MKEVIIKYNPDGTVEIEAEGFQGTSCLQGTLPYEKALGINSSNSRKTMKTGMPGGKMYAYRNRNKIHS